MTRISIGTRVDSDEGPGASPKTRFFFDFPNQGFFNRFGVLYKTPGECPSASKGRSAAANEKNFAGSDPHRIGGQCRIAERFHHARERVIGS